VVINTTGKRRLAPFFLPQAQHKKNRRQAQNVICQQQTERDEITINYILNYYFCYIINSSNSNNEK